MASLIWIPRALCSSMRPGPPPMLVPAKAGMARSHGWAPRGQRLRVSIPHGHWKTTTFIGGLRWGMIAPFVLDRSINRIALETYVEKVLIPELRPGDIVVMDNLSSHKGPRVAEMIEAAGARLLYLPPTARTSIQSKTPSPSSRPSFERRPSAPSMVCGPQSVTSSIPSRRKNAPITSPPPDMMQRDRILL
jgi:hypothetical protein